MCHSGIDRIRTTDPRTDVLIHGGFAMQGAFWAQQLETLVCFERADAQPKQIER